ncbi:hypothetical protein HMJ29_04275 [Hymenobacter taeanensis]|uniref:DUF4177 domain-containing protein n=1 Tax=Hymenobacter taeanensis TaxID=2735321 RepID=A0A6M6BEM8_9BACT|nr:MULTISPECIES: hypothetical protein [Hymenobacter]QJX46194.1 hypothetical protein HMJ29_04275 [Hymenobacter taeanensis]UOQ80050.1 hypothetical protein MUN83_14540 [Hymenobacter sp. 5414T-23]
MLLFVRCGFLLPAVLALRLAAAQGQPHTGKAPVAPLPNLPETALQPVLLSTVLPPAGGLRFRYQIVRLYNDRCVYLAPAWRGQTKLQPPRQGLFSSPEPGEVDALLVGAVNELAQEGWELVEIQTSAQPLQATQKVETSLAYHDPQRPTYTGTTTIEMLHQTRYLLRKPLTPASSSGPR